ncbi:MAG TPA: LytR C-terminal domain-containing protein [bacterium]|nr:LytR C-terminal domain-containing protein [bacterium]
MAEKRVSSGRLVRVERRRRGRKWRVVLGVVAALAVVAIIIVAFRYKSRRQKPEEPPLPPTAETAAVPATAATAEVPTPATGRVSALVVNGTSVPQRFGNALAALEDFNVECGNAVRFEQSRPKIAYPGESSVYFRDGFEDWAEEMAAALAADIPRERVDFTIICGQDISQLILEALAKNVPAPEDTNVEVLNGCGIEGAAAKMRERLEANGYTVVAMGNAATFDYKKTVIETGEGGRDAALRAAALFGLGDDRLEPSSYDVKIIIGDDYTVATEAP